MSKMTYLNNCVGWPRRDVHAEGGLIDMIDDPLSISRRTFLKHVDGDELKQLEADFGYSDHYKRGMTMAADYHVRYYRSKLHGETVYYVEQSGIEYVFACPESNLH